MTRPYEIQQGGWIEIGKLEEYGIQMGEMEAEGLGKGMGAGGKMRFEVKNEDGEDGEGRKMLIRLIRKYERTDERQRRQRGYTPMW